VKPPTPGGVLRLFVAIALTGVLLWTSSPRDVARALTGVAWPPLLVAVVLVAVDRVLMAYRWLVLLRPFAGPDGPRFSAVVRIFLVSTFVGTFLPAQWVAMPSAPMPFHRNACRGRPRSPQC